MRAASSSCSTRALASIEACADIETASIMRSAGSRAASTRQPGRVLPRHGRPGPDPGHPGSRRDDKEAGHDRGDQLGAGPHRGRQRHRRKARSTTGHPRALVDQSARRRGTCRRERRWRSTQPGAATSHRKSPQPEERGLCARPAPMRGRVSPPASEGTSFTDITGAQGPTGGRGDSTSPGTSGCSWRACSTLGRKPGWSRIPPARADRKGLVATPSTAFREERKAGLDRCALGLGTGDSGGSGALRDRW